MERLPLLSLFATQALLPATPAAAQRLQHPRAVRIQGEQLARFRLLRGDTPEQHYPPAARAAKLDGYVTVDLLLNDTGQVLEAQVISELPKDAGFGLAALDAAKTFEFENPLRRLVLLAVTVEFLP